MRQFTYNKTSVVKLVISSGDSYKKIMSNLSMKLFGRSSKVVLKLDILLSAVEKCKVTPTFIFEINRHWMRSEVQGFEVARVVAKMLSPYASVIIDLEEPSDVLEYGGDRFREKFIFVGEMTTAEATTLVRQGLQIQKQQQEVQFSDEELQHIIEEVLANARQDLMLFPHQDILRAFQEKKSRGADLSVPKEVEAAMLWSNAVVYRMEKREYQLSSIAHKTALKSHDPIM